MIKKIGELEKHFNLGKAATMIAVLTLASRIVGLMRDRLFASRFGAGDTLDVYYAAFRVPDFIFNLLVLGTLSVAFIPVFTEHFIKDKQRAFKIASTVLNFSLLLMGGTCLVLFLFSRPLTKLLVPGFNDIKFQGTLLLTRLFLLSPLIFTASNVFGSILNSQKRFLVANTAPILYNLGIIFGLIMLYPSMGLYGLGFGVILGAVLHFFVQMAEAFRLGFVWQKKMDLEDEAVRKIGKLFIPRIFGLDPSQISLLVGSIIGSLLASGTIAILNLANNLQAVPVGIFAISIAVAAFPSLSEQYAERDHESFLKTLAGTVNQILFFIIPISIFILLFRAYIVRLVYGAGKFDWADTIATFSVLGIFAISLFAQSLVPLFSRAFYARQNTKVPVLVGLIFMAVNIGLSYFLAIHNYTLYFNVAGLHASVITKGVNGIALAFTLASILNCLTLFILLRASMAKDLQTDSPALTQFDGSIAVTIGKVLTASLAMGLAGYVAIYLIAPFVNTRTTFGILIQSGLASIVCLAVFLLAARLLQLPQVASIKVFAKRIFRLA